MSRFVKEVLFLTFAILTVAGCTAVAWQRPEVRRILQPSRTEPTAPAPPPASPQDPVQSFESRMDQYRLAMREAHPKYDFIGYDVLHGEGAQILVWHVTIRTPGAVGLEEESRMMADIMGLSEAEGYLNVAVIYWDWQMIMGCQDANIETCGAIGNPDMPRLNLPPSLFVEG